MWSRADLVVHDGAQAHDAHVDVVFLADQPGVLQSSPARQRVTTAADGKNVKETTGVKKKKGAGRIQTRAGELRINLETDALVNEPLWRATLTQGGY